jgi:hypothetical protein
VGPGLVKLAWSDNANDETGVRVEREKRVKGAWGGST